MCGRYVAVIGSRVVVARLWCIQCEEKNPHVWTATLLDRLVDRVEILPVPLGGRVAGFGEVWQSLV